MTMHLFQAWSDSSLLVAQWGLTWFLQSVLLTTCGLSVAAAARRWGAATQSAIYRTTLVAVLLTPAVSVLVGRLAANGWSLPYFAGGAGAHGGSQTDLALASHSRDASNIGTPIPENPYTPAHDATAKTTQGTLSPGHVAFNFMTPLRDLLAFEGDTGHGAGHANAAMLAGILGTLWLAAAFALLARLARAWLGIRSLCRASIEVDRATALLCQKLSQSYGIACPELRRSPFVTSPCAVGIWRPTILLTDDDSSLNVGDVLAHELAHVARHDGLWNFLRHVATSCLFMQPLVWWLSRRIEATAEEVCDDVAMRSGADPLRYAEQLCNLAVLGLPAPAAAAAVGMKTARTVLSRRIGRILDSTRQLSTGISLRRVSAIVAAGVFITALTGLVGAGGSNPAATDKAAGTALNPNENRQPVALSGAAPVVPEEQAAPPSETKPRKGKIYLRAFLRSRDPQAKEKFSQGIFEIDPETGKWRRLLDRGLSPRVSPDGETLVFSDDDKLWSCDTNEAGNPGAIADLNGRVTWMADSKHLVISTGKYIENEGWKCETWQIRADGLDKTALPIPETDFVDDISRDGKAFVTSSDRHPPKGSGYQLYVMRPDGTEQRRLTKEGLNVGARIAPDGRRVAYVFQNRDGNKLKLINIDGTGEQTILSENGGADSVGGVAWSPDGKRLAVIRYDWKIDGNGKRFLTAGDDANYRIEIMDADGANRRRLELTGAEPDSDVLELSEPDWR
jgi:beta-lactamase regulating signal transducer with metallopeptidase domain